MRCLGVFVQAPIPGRVKSRLAEDVGPSVAAEVYWQIGRRVIAQVTGSEYRAAVWYTPSSEATFVREWLDGLGGLELRPQPPGPFSDRLSVAFGRYFAEGARRAVIIGVDCPGVDRRLVADAFSALTAHDVVIGPTSAGHTYLVGLRAPQPALLHGVSTAVVQQITRRAAAARLRVRLLRALRAVQTAQDARLAGLLESRPTMGQD